MLKVCFRGRVYLYVDSEAAEGIGMGGGRVLGGFVEMVRCFSKFLKRFEVLKKLKMAWGKCFFGKKNVPAGICDTTRMTLDHSCPPSSLESPKRKAGAGMGIGIFK